eukprot:5200949-Amphidinium_carterae.1
MKDGVPLGLAHAPPRGHKNRRTCYFDMGSRACDRACENMFYTCQSASLRICLAMWFLCGYSTCLHRRATGIDSPATLHI